MGPHIPIDRVVTVTVLLLTVSAGGVRAAVSVDESGRATRVRRLE